MKKTYSCFSLIEIIVSIFVFVMGILAIYGIILSWLRLNQYSKNAIIASYLAKESMELVKNLRDSNYHSLYLWNTLPDRRNIFQTGVYYTIENNFSWEWPSILMHPIRDFCEWKTCIPQMQAYQLYQDNQKRYTYVKEWNTPTRFYRYIVFEDVLYGTPSSRNILENAIKIRTKVIWMDHGYHELELQTILTDWKKQ